MKQPQRNRDTNRDAGAFPARTRRPIMLSKLSLSLTAALALSAARAGVARAASMPTSTDEAREMAHPSTNAEIDAAEAGNPHSIDYSDRMIPSRPATNDEINAVESGSPDSVDNKDQQRPPGGENWRADWQSDESEDPDSP
ncbi:MAG: hypothetical protein E6J65_19875 [Deltaproteobacteria bacterium]|nr:MAG: hypothetical protein E6J65_19875 [Deltaproteobacteria bacterium]